jgi:hypothetical protein
MRLEVMNVCARKGKSSKWVLKKLCWFLVFCDVFVFRHARPSAQRLVGVECQMEPDG